MVWKKSEKGGEIHTREIVRETLSKIQVPRKEDITEISRLGVERRESERSVSVDFRFWNKKMEVMRGGKKLSRTLNYSL